MGKTKNKEPSSPEEILYEVEHICAAKVVKLISKGKKKKKVPEWEYFIKWGGYPEEENTWEPMRSLRSCAEALDRFWGALDIDHTVHHRVGTVAEAPMEWILQEKRNYRDRKSERSESDADTDITDVEDGSEEGDIPEPSPSPGKKKRKKKAKVVHVVDSSDDASESIPKSKRRKTSHPKTAHRQKQATPLEQQQTEQEDDLCGVADALLLPIPRKKKSIRIDSDSESSEPVQVQPHLTGQTSGSPELSADGNTHPSPLPALFLHTSALGSTPALSQDVHAVFLPPTPPQSPSPIQEIPDEEFALYLRSRSPTPLGANIPPHTAILEGARNEMPTHDPVSDEEMIVAPYLTVGLTLAESPTSPTSGESTTMPSSVLESLGSMAIAPVSPQSAPVSDIQTDIVMGDVTMPPSVLPTEEPLASSVSASPKAKARKNSIGKTLRWSSPVVVDPKAASAAGSSPSSSQPARVRIHGETRPQSLKAPRAPAQEVGSTPDPSSEPGQGSPLTAKTRANTPRLKPNLVSDALSPLDNKLSAAGSSETTFPGSLDTARSMAVDPVSQENLSGTVTMIVDSPLSAYSFTMRHHEKEPDQSALEDIPTPEPRQSPEVFPTSPSVPTQKLPPLPTRRLRPSISPSASEWAWQGDLVVVDPDENTAANIKVLISGERQLRASSTGFRLSTPFDELRKGLHVKSFYDMGDLRPIFKACKAPSYVAEVTQMNSLDQWKTTIQFMIKTKKVALVPLDLSEETSGLLLLYPPQLEPVALPSGLPTQPDSLLVVLIPWSLSEAQICRDTRLTPRKLDPTMEQRLQQLTRGSLKIQRSRKHEMSWRTNWTKAIKYRPSFQLAIRVLGFPEEIYTYLKTTSRTWSIFGKPYPGFSKKVYLETRLLVSILQRIKVETPSFAHTPSGNFPSKSCIRETSTSEKPEIVFIHLGVLQDALNQFPSFTNLILSGAYVRVYVFGSHPSISPTNWGIQEIFPCGGVMTITPGSILTDPVATKRRLDEACEHPLWVVYILPSVLGMIVETAKTMERQVPITYLLKAISKGNIALLQAPPDPTTWLGNNHSKEKWLKTNIHPIPLTPISALSQGIEAYKSAYSNMPKSQQEVHIEKEVFIDLRMMQKQPCMFTGYRRFVALTGDKTGQYGSVECSTPMKFQFTDTH